MSGHHLAAGCVNEQTALSYFSEVQYANRQAGWSGSGVATNTAPRIDQA